MILITGANGNLGRRLIESLGEGFRVRAVVRSQRAARSITTAGVEVRIVDYLDLEAMAEAAQGCSHIVHLVGIIKESTGSTYEAAHQGTSTVIAQIAALAGVSRVVYLSILGATLASRNPCLASKARAETLLLGGAVPVLVLRIPMVLGEGDFASRSLYHRARRRFSLQLRASSLEQPIYAGDVIEAIQCGIDGDRRDAGVGQSIVLDLAGPRSLSRRALTKSAATILGNRTRVISLPLWFGLLGAWLLEKVSADPPVSRAMLEVLDHDDDIDPRAAMDQLGMSLTPLEQALRRCLVDSPPV
ncbi:MAG: SDR family oxidoreductase [Pseudomonadales bacterium]